MKTLAQIEARTPISSVPFTINESGSYYLTNNVSVSSGDAITIAASNVTLDLNGFTVRSTQEPANTASGILLGSGLHNIRIANGFIESGVTHDVFGVYGGTGFGYGIYYSGPGPRNALVSGVGVSGCLYHGIYIDYSLDAPNIVESCVVQTVGGSGIVASTVRNSSAMDCGDSGVLGAQVSDCRGQARINFGVYGHTVLNCYGTSVNGYGVAATAAENCYGSGNLGIYALHTALGCYGVSSSGIGIDAGVALNCYGQSSGNSGFGLRANSAQNCQGYNYAAGTGLYGIDSAIGCVGYANSGTGLSAYIANSSRGTTSSGTAQAITFKYNMP
jgi:hypothetical protein